jgi:hypothetical protein
MPHAGRRSVRWKHLSVGGLRAIGKSQPLGFCNAAANDEFRGTRQVKEGGLSRPRQKGAKNKERNRAQAVSGVSKKKKKSAPDPTL